MISGIFFKMKQIKYKKLYIHVLALICYIPLYSNIYLHVHVGHKRVSVPPVKHYRHQCIDYLLSGSSSHFERTQISAYEYS